MHYEAMIMDARREARIETILDVAKTLLRKNFSKEEIMEIAKCTQEQFLQAKRELGIPINADTTV